MIRVVSYNVSGGRETGALAAVLAPLAADIVCLLEVPSARRLRRIARGAGLEVAERAGRRGTGTAVLVGPRVTVRESDDVSLTTRPGMPERAASHALVTCAGARLSVTAVQFGLHAELRRHNLSELAPFLDGIDALTVVGADLNETVRSPVAAWLAAAYQDAFGVAGSGAGATYPTQDPSTRQDFVFVDHRLVVTAARTVTDGPVTRASHHLPVLAEVEGGPDGAEGP
jgi:endonuclease/exonuclease/phosphatase family metal-dependent hydrolase